MKKREAKGLDNSENEGEANATRKEDNFRKLAWEKLKGEWPDFCGSEGSDEAANWSKAPFVNPTGPINP